MAFLANQSISVFFPCFNDEQTIGTLVEEAMAVLGQVVNRYEVIVVEDGSTDDSRRVLKDLAEKYPGVFQPVFHTKNRGYGGALRSGFKKARYDLIFYTDGDGQYDVKELPLLLSLMTRDVNFVNGIKMERQDYGYRVILGNFYALLMRWIFLLPIFDVDCDFRLIRRSLVKRLSLKSDSGSICVELVKQAEKAGARFRQVSVHHYPRKYGESQFFKPRRLIKTFLELVPLWWRLMIRES